MPDSLFTLSGKVVKNKQKILEHIGGKKKKPTREVSLFNDRLK